MACEGYCSPWYSSIDCCDHWLVMATALPIEQYILLRPWACEGYAFAGFLSGIYPRGGGVGAEQSVHTEAHSRGWWHATPEMAPKNGNHAMLEYIYLLLCVVTLCGCKPAFIPSEIHPEWRIFRHYLIHPRKT